jgi:hypothetical protein
MTSQNYKGAVSDSIFAGAKQEALDMATELVGYFYREPPRDQGESPAAYEARKEADKRAVMAEMLSNGGYAMDRALMQHTIDTIQDGTFQHASMFKYGGSSPWRKMVLQWIQDTFVTVSPSTKSRVADVITELLPTLGEYGVTYDIDEVISLIVDRGRLKMPWKVRLAVETLRDAREQGRLSHELVQRVYRMLLNQEDSSDNALEKAGRPARVKIPGLFKITGSGYRLEVDVTDEVTARLIERKLSPIVDWQWDVQKAHTKEIETE